MRAVAHAAIAAAKKAGAEYADIRVGRSESEGLTVRNGRIGGLSRHEGLSFGVRALFRGAWGFAASSTPSPAAAAQVAKLAVAIARASAAVRGEPVRLADEPPHRAQWQTPVVIDPFAVALDDKLALLYRCDELMRRRKQIRAAIGSASCSRRSELFASTAGAEIEQVFISSGAFISATAVGKGDSQSRTWPAMWGQHKGMGWELILGLDLAAHAERVSEEAVALLSAPPCPQRKTDLVLGGAQLVLQIHESVGHPTELDRALGWEANYAGTSFATPEKLGKFRYGSKIVNLVADSTVPTGLATRGFDDDGVAMQRWDVVREGILTGYATNRETARYVKQKRSRGCNRAESPSAIPITRIPNLSLMPGDAGRFEDLIAETKKGVWMDTNRCWSIDQRRLNFQFGCEIAREIKNGRLGRLYKNPTYQGITPEFWGSCDAICSSDEWDLWGVANCGKGQPGQRSEMSHGTAPARFRGVTVGVRA